MVTGLLMAKHHTVHHIIDVGEIADEIAIVDELDGVALHDVASYEHGTGVRSAPGAVGGEESENGDRQIEGAGVGVAKEFG